MNRFQYELLVKVPVGEAIIQASEFMEGALRHDRTLAFGYDCDRRTWHVYLYDGEIHLLCYTSNHAYFHKQSDVHTCDSIATYMNKRVYPERSDFKFMSEMKDRGYPLTMLPWKEAVEPKQFYGRTHLEESWYP